MYELPKDRATARCACGSVELEAIGDPIVSTACYCESCQEGSRQIEALPNGRPVCDPDGGTAMVLYRKDRVEYPKGSELLRDHKIREGSPTSRVVAACCDSAMYLEFEKGHWLSVYRPALRGDAPPPEMRVHTKSKPAGVDLRTTCPTTRVIPSSSWRSSSLPRSRCCFVDEPGPDTMKGNDEKALPR